MDPTPFRPCRLLVCLLVSVSLLGGAAASLGVCGPFVDVAGDAFCAFVLEIFYLGITTGTTPTTYDPTGNVSRLQMAAFLSRTVDGTLRRGNRRAALRQFSTPQVGDFLGLTTVGQNPLLVECDGSDVWVSNNALNTISRVRASDGKLLETWTGALGADGLVVALGKIFVSGTLNPGSLYRIDPSQPAGGVTIVASNLGGSPQGVAFDGSRIWTANFSSSVSLVTPGATIPWTTQTVTVGFQNPRAALYDGSNIWVTDEAAGRLLKLDSNAAVLQTVTVGSGPKFPAFDGANIWVPNAAVNSITVVRASNGAVLGALNGNGLNFPFVAAFDGQRILVTNAANGANTVSLWKAADLTALGFFPTGLGSPSGAASDGINFWITLSASNTLARF